VVDVAAAALALSTEMLLAGNRKATNTRYRRQGRSPEGRPGLPRRYRFGARVSGVAFGSASFAGLHGDV